MNTGELKRVLRAHYVGADGNSEEWVLFDELRSDAGFNGGTSQCDLLAVNTWPSRGFRRVGHEVKVSRGDWLKEMKNPAKADWWWKLCHHWYLVVPKPYRDIVKDGELPDGWGLMEVSDTKVRVVVKPTSRPAPNPITASMMVGMFAHTDRRQKRHDANALRLAHQAGRAEGLEAGRLQKHEDRLVESARLTQQRASEFARATGIDMNDNATWRLPEIVQIVNLVKSWGGLGSVSDQLRQARQRLAGCDVALGKLIDETDAFQLKQAP